jgi:hypothetical protein
MRRIRRTCLQWMLRNPPIAAPIRSSPNRISSALLRRLVEVPLTTLMFQCPRTKRLVSTSIDIDLADIDKLPDRVTFSQCPYCLPDGARMDAKEYFRLRRHAGSTPESIAAHEVRCPPRVASGSSERSRKSTARGNFDAANCLCNFRVSSE